MTIPAPYRDWFPEAELDGTYGFDLPALRRVEPVPVPDGFADRWRAWRAQAQRMDASPERTPVGEQDGRRLSIVEHAGADGTRLRAWLAEPIDGPARIGVVHGHGYGGRAAPDFARVPDDAAVIFPVARGLGALNTGVGAPSTRDDHVVAGLEDPDRSVLGLCARDLWLAADALCTLAGPLPLAYVGESFGGGIGALALPWDDRYIAATLIVPSFGQHDERLAVRCLGSGEALRRHVQAHPAARDVLRLFDASTAMLLNRIPVRVEAALWDANVPPQGQFAIANAVARSAGPLELAVLPAGHAVYPGRERLTREFEEAGRAHLDQARGAHRLARSRGVDLAPR
ncbi:acetylxylan esterase family protein [Microbacterium xylanilyticum]